MKLLVWFLFLWSTTNSLPYDYISSKSNRFGENYRYYPLALENLPVPQYNAKEAGREKVNLIHENIAPFLKSTTDRMSDKNVFRTEEEPIKHHSLQVLGEVPNNRGGIEIHPNSKQSNNNFKDYEEGIGCEQRENLNMNPKFIEYKGDQNDEKLAVKSHDRYKPNSEMGQTFETPDTKTMLHFDNKENSNTRSSINDLKSGLDHNLRLKQNDKSLREMRPCNKEIEHLSNCENDLQPKGDDGTKEEDGMFSLVVRKIWHHSPKSDLNDKGEYPSENQKLQICNE